MSNSYLYKNIIEKFNSINEKIENSDIEKLNFTELKNLQTEVFQLFNSAAVDFSNSNFKYYYYSKYIYRFVKKHFKIYKGKSKEQKKNALSYLQHCTYVIKLEIERVIR